MPIGGPYSIPIETCYGNLKVTSCGASTASTGMATGTIVAIILGSFFGLLIIMGICFYIVRKNEPRYTQPVQMRPFPNRIPRR